jgi:hypothetical protein
MQTANSIVGHHQNVVQIPVSMSSHTGVTGWLTKLFGCWHKELSRPFSLHGQAYRTCIHCGARRQFNVGRWQMQGDFYYRSGSTAQLRAA